MCCFTCLWASICRPKQIDPHAQIMMSFCNQRYYSIYWCRADLLTVLFSIEASFMFFSTSQPTFCTKTSYKIYTGKCLASFRPTSAQLGKEERLWILCVPLCFRRTIFVKYFQLARREISARALNGENSAHKYIAKLPEAVDLRKSSSSAALLQ